MSKGSDRQAPSRRAVLVGVGAAAVAPNIVLAQAGALIVETTSGRVQGFRADGIAQFRGIPYGGDAAGRNRFMPPTRPAAWGGIRDCTQWGHVAPQATFAEQQAPGHAADALAVYRRLYPAKRPYLVKAMIATDVRVRRNATVQAERKAVQRRAPAYLYRWDWPAPGGDGQWGAVHGTDLSPAMSNPTTPTTIDTPGARTMSRRIGQAFIAFAKTGDPNHPAIPRWPAYDPSTRAVMVFDDQTRVIGDPDRDLRLMWNRLKAA